MRKNSVINNIGSGFAEGANEKQKAACGGINRILDANLNRASEGLRVCEEITRFILENHAKTLYLKKIRHEIRSLAKALPARINLIKDRNAREDTGKNIYVNELKRKNIRDIFLANIQRVKESIRVLEEFSKLTNIRIAIRFKKIRYNIYEIEKLIIQSIKTKR